MPNAIIAKGMDISIGSVHLYHDPQIEVVIKIVAAGIPENNKEVDEEDAEVVEEDHSQLEPLWLCRDQKHLDMDRSWYKIRVFPQFPVQILLEEDRETS